MQLPSFLLKLSTDRFVKNNVIYFIGSGIIAFLNYLYYPILGRIIRIQDFGELQTILSIVLQAGIILSVFGIAVTNITANMKDKKEDIAVITTLEQIAYYITFGIFLVIIILSLQLKSFFQFSSIYPFIGLALLFIINVPMTLRNAFIQGKHDFKNLSISGIIYGLGKIVFSFVLVLLGWRTFGALVGIILGLIASLLFLFIQTRNEMHMFSFKTSNLSITPAVKKRVLKELQYIGFIFIVYITITLLYTSDVLVVKHFFPPLVAGLYASIATAARTIYFITASVAAVLIPSISIHNKKKENLLIFLKSFVIVACIGGCITIFFAIEPRFVINTLMGKRYIAYSYVLPLLSAAVFCTSLVNLTFTYCIALRDFFSLYIAILSFVCITISIILFHQNIFEIVNCFLFVNFFTLFFLCIYIFYNNYRSYVT